MAQGLRETNIKARARDGKTESDSWTTVTSLISKIIIIMQRNLLYLDFPVKIEFPSTIPWSECLLKS